MLFANRDESADLVIVCHHGSGKGLHNAGETVDFFLVVTWVLLLPAGSGLI